MNARYDNGWYYAWLIERRDLAQPEWWSTACTWTTNAHEALWFARESDAQAEAAECWEDVRVVEHGFQLEKPTSAEVRDDNEQGVRT